MFRSGAESLKRSFIDFYRDLSFLQSFCIINYTGFMKILSKHDKKRSVDLRSDYSALIRELDFFKADGVRFMFYGCCLVVVLLLFIG